MPSPETPGHSTGKSGSISCGVTALFSWVLVYTGCICALQKSVSPVCVSSVIKSHWPPKSNSLGVLLWPNPQVGKFVVGPRTFLTVQEFIWYNCSAVCGLSGRQLYGGANGDLLPEGLCHTQDCCTQSPWPWGRPLLTNICMRHSNTQRQGLGGCFYK